MNEIFSYIGETFYIIYILILLGTIMVVIMENRNPLKTMSWLMILIFLPALGLIIYFLFGQKWSKKHRIDKRNYNIISRSQLEKYLKQASVELPKEYFGLAELFRKTEKSFPYNGNSVDVYYNGYDFYTALLKEIKESRHHIHIEFYIFLSDETGNLIKDALIEKAREGVKIRIIIDDVGSWKIKKSFIKELKDNGIEIISFLPVNMPLISNKINYRNHRKLVIIDGKTAFIGGMNIANRYIKGLKWGIWRDTQIRIKGYTVHELQTIFFLDWNFATKENITDQSYFPKCDSSGSATVLVATSTPFNEWRRIMQGLVLALTRAKKYFYIQTPYFMPTEPVICAMQTAALAGVDIRIIIPSRSDSTMTQLATRSYLKDILKAGVKVYFYKPGFIHSKMMVSDDTLSIIGSTNMDFRSFEQNFELNAFIFDRETALNIKEQFNKDQKDSKRITLHNWKKRPFYYKLKESIVRIFSPLL